MGENDSMVIRVTDRDRAWMLQIRRAFGFSQESVAARIGYNRTYYGHIERGYLCTVRMRFFNRLNEFYRTNYEPEDSNPVTYHKSLYKVPLTVEYCDWMYNNRIKHGLTMQDVGKHIGCSAAYYSQLEDRHVRRIGTQYVERLEALYGEADLTDCYIFKGGNEK